MGSSFCLCSQLCQHPRLTLPRLQIMKAFINPKPGEFFLYAILRQSRAQIVEAHMIERLVLIEAGEDDRFLAGFRIGVHLQALGTNLFHHALHRRIDGADGEMIRIQERFQNRMPGFLHTMHQAIGTDDDEPLAISERNIRFAQIAASVGEHRFDDVADKRFILYAIGGEAGAFVTAPSDNVRSLFNFFDLITVRSFSCNPRSRRHESPILEASGRSKTAPRFQDPRRSAEPFQWTMFQSVCRSAPSARSVRPV